MRRFMTFLPLLAACCGCPVTQSQDVPVPASRHVEPVTGEQYRQYVPKDYRADRKWPLVVTLHGTRAPAYDTDDKQINEWKKLAEDRQFIVVAPRLQSVQGILPVIKSIWFKDLARDEQVILAVIDEVCKKYNIDEKCIMLTGFSSGGYPMYYTGLRNPERFNALAARACNSSIEIFERIKLTDKARKLPIFIFWGKDDFKPVQDQSWAAFRYLRERRFRKTERKEIKGGHLRRPDIAYRFWKKYLPEEYRR